MIGNLGKDPELSYTPTGKACARFSLAVNRRGPKKTTDEETGERQERQELTQWFNVVVWERLAETCNAYLHKGSKVYLEGRIGSRDYTDKEHQKRTIWEVTASDLEMLDAKPTHGDDRDAPPPDESPF